MYARSSSSSKQFSEEQSSFAQLKTWPTYNSKIYFYCIFGVVHANFLNPFILVGIYGDPLAKAYFWLTTSHCIRVS